MSSYSAFDILGPIMIGPSSSHTAGAARLAKIAKAIAGNEIAKVSFVLHGSFAKTYKGHGTDKALLAGILGMDPWDERLKNSFNIAKEKNIIFSFEEEDMGDVHPNTVKFIIDKKNGKQNIIVGSSIGGGNVEIIEIDGLSVSFKGDYPTLIINNIETPGMIAKVTKVLYDVNINIAFLKVYRTGKGCSAFMVIETDSIVPRNIIDEISSVGKIKSIKFINPVREVN